MKQSFTNDFAKKIGYDYGFGFAVSTPEGAKVLLTAVREQLAGPFSLDELSKLELLGWNISQAIRLQEAFIGIKLQRGGLLECMDQLHHGVILTDSTGRIACVNRVAEAMTSSNDGLALSTGEIHGRVPHERSQIQAMIASATRTQGPGGTVLVTRPSGSKPFDASN